MSLQTKFINFRDTIQLGREDAAYKDAKDKDESILIAIKKAFREAGYPVIDSFYQGSMSTNTAITHPIKDFDIDRALIIDANDAPDNPMEVKKLVLQVLENRGFKNATIKKPCVTADYASLNLHIDITVYRKNGDSYELAVGKASSDENNREWSPSAPKKLINYINSKDEYYGSSEDKLKQFKRLVRYIKRWRDNKFSSVVGNKIYSIGVSVMFKDKFAPSFSDDGKANDLQALRDTVHAVINGGYFETQSDDKYKVRVTLPTLPYRDIFHSSSIDTGTQFRNKLVSMRTKLDEALEESSLIKQCEIMRGLFGDDFEVPDSDQGNTISKVAYTSAGVVGTSQGA
tara:strand:+ start:6853 stop:7884 length:1032 start_codon:yes stop_codon:yes gene_type:complete